MTAVAVGGAVSAQPGNGYRIGPRDRLEVRVAELPELFTQAEVSENGTLTLPIIGPVEGAGFTEAELADRIRTALEEQYVRKATVSVRVLEYRARPVSILGAVASPGNVLVPGRASLLDVIMKAGGLSSKHGEMIHIRRRADNGLSDQVQIAIDDLIARGDPRVNIPILAGDFINVPEAQEVTIHLLGEVSRAGTQTFLSSDNVTLLRAIAAAGGLSDSASSKLRIMRRTPSGKRQEIAVDYRRILRGRDADVQLEDGDIIVVKESFF